MLILGMGLGRCGTAKLQRLLNYQEGAYITHESMPRFPWDGVGGDACYTHHADNFRINLTKKRHAGDIARGWLEYVERALADFPTAKIIILQQDKEAVVANVAEFAHFALSGEDIGKATSDYYDYYYAKAEKYREAYPNNVLFLDAAQLDTMEGQARVFAFLGIENPHYVKSGQGEKGKGLPNILIATPNLGSINIHTALNIIRWSLSKKYNVHWYTPVNIVPQSRARCLCHQTFLESDCEYLFFLDAFIDAPEEAIDVLLQHDKPMVSVTAQTYKKDGCGDRILVPTSFTKKQDGNYYPYIGEGLTQVDITHCACTMIKRRVMEAVARPAFQFTHTGKFGVEGFGEDFYFSLKVAEAGFDIFNDYGLLSDHYQTVGTASINEMINRAKNESVHATFQAIRAGKC